MRLPDNRIGQAAVDGYMLWLRVRLWLFLHRVALSVMIVIAIIAVGVFLPQVFGRTAAFLAYAFVFTLFLGALLEAVIPKAWLQSQRNLRVILCLLVALALLCAWHQTRADFAAFTGQASVPADNRSP